MRLKKQAESRNVGGGQVQAPSVYRPHAVGMEGVGVTSRGRALRTSSVLGESVLSSPRQRLSGPTPRD